MNVRLTLKWVLAGAALGIVAAVMWQSQHDVVPPSSHITPQRTPLVSAAVPASQPSTPLTLSTQAHAADLRTQFRQSRNYAQFVQGLAGAAAAGEPLAEYLTARALKYCSDNIRLHFRNSNGSGRTRDEVEVRVGKFPSGLQQEILDAYDRCSDFLAEPNPLGATSGWEGWLEKAAAAGYPPAQSLQADVWRQADLMRDASKVMGLNAHPAHTRPGQNLALQAVLSGDPESILEMANWVDGTKHSLDESGSLLGAWELLACQRSYDDCGRNSELFRSLCNWDPQCADDSSITDSLSRQFGSHFDEIKSLADAIGRAIDHHDQAAIESYL